MSAWTWKEAVTYEKSTAGVNYLAEDVTAITGGLKVLNGSGTFDAVPVHTMDGGTGTLTVFTEPGATDFKGPLYNSASADSSTTHNLWFKTKVEIGGAGLDRIEPVPISTSTGSTYEEAWSTGPLTLMGNAAGTGVELVSSTEMWIYSYDEHGNPTLAGGRAPHNHDQTKGYLRKRGNKISTDNTFTHATAVGFFTLQDIANGNTDATDVTIIEVDETANDMTIQLPYTPAIDENTGLPEISNITIAKVGGADSVSVDNPMAQTGVPIAMQGRLLKFNYDESGANWATPIEDGELAAEISVTYNYWANLDLGDADINMMENAVTTQSWIAKGVHAGGVDPSVNDLFSNSGIGNSATYETDDNYKVFGTGAGEVANYDNAFTLEYLTDGSETALATFKMTVSSDFNNGSDLAFKSAGSSTYMSARRTFSTDDDDPNGSLGDSSATINLYNMVDEHSKTGDLAVGKCTTNFNASDETTGVFILTQAASI